MIISTVELLYDARNGQKWAFIEMAIAEWEVSLTGIKYTVIDHAIKNDVREFISKKVVAHSWDQINSLNDYLESQNDYSGLSKKDHEFLKVKHALLLETKTNPVYSSLSNQWILKA